MSITDFSKLKIKSCIGVGGFAKVRLCYHETDKYAIKIISKDTNQTENIKREVIAGKKLRHDNISSFVEWFDDEVSDYLLFKYAEGVDLFTYLNEFTTSKFLDENTCKIIFHQLVLAVEHMHIKGIVHMDLKLENVIVDPKTLKTTLIDFGLCDFITPENGGWFTRRVGSELYAPWEIMDERKGCDYNGEKVDIWLLGVVLFAMLNGRMPFSDKRIKEIRKFGKHPFVPIQQCKISNEAKDLLSKLMALEAKDRIDTNTILRHKWFS
jgi:serine/threonine protein kinase